MIAIPTLEEEDAKRPGRERDALVGERTRIINRFKSTLAWLGIRGFKPHLRDAAARLETLRTPEGMPLPANAMAELRREIARLQLIAGQIREIEAARVERLEQQPGAGVHPMVRVLAQIRGVGVETARQARHEGFSRPLRDQRAVARSCPRAGRRRTPGGLTGSPDATLSENPHRAGQHRLDHGRRSFSPSWTILSKWVHTRPVPWQRSGHPLRSGSAARDAALSTI